MWAYLDAGSIAGIVERTLHPHDARDHYRGHVGLDPWAQVVEGLRLSGEGWRGLDLDDLAAEVEPSADGDAAHVILRWDGPDGAGSREADVRVRRRYPVLECGLPPESAKKTAPEFEVA